MCVRQAGCHGTLIALLPTLLSHLPLATCVWHVACLLVHPKWAGMAWLGQNRQEAGRQRRGTRHPLTFCCILPNSTSCLALLPTHDFSFSILLLLTFMVLLPPPPTLFLVLLDMVTVLIHGCRIWEADVLTLLAPGP